MKNIQLKSFANGTINLKEKSIELNDISSRMNMGIFKISPFVFLFFGVYLIYTGIIAESQVQLILRILPGIILVSIPALLYHSNFIRTNKKEIELNEIKNVEVKKVFEKY
jgi:Na+-transporting methylmalonyl-CoA/oxaloacetate decarboxylase beta subunit